MRHPDIIGESPALAEALEALREAAASNVTYSSPEKPEPARNCSPAPCTQTCLRASRPVRHRGLYHFARNAGGGASVRTRPGRVHRTDRTREGLLAAADHGTLFLDEVGELPLPVQGAFLRALELRRFRPVGEVREVESDFRLVAATNRDLDDMVGMDLYRSDLASGCGA